MRRIVSFVLAGLVALGGGTVLALSSAQQALAVNPLTLEVPEPTPITHSPYLFYGHGDPGDVVTVNSAISTPCISLPADVAGYWECNVHFTGSSDLVSIQAIRADDGTPMQDEETWEYSVALPVAVTQNQPGAFLTNNPAAPITGSGAWPTATMTVTVNGILAVCGAADGAGNWSCTPPALGPGTYPISAQQTAGGATSDPTISSYVLDTSTFIPRFDYPFDSTLPPADVQTSDTTPLVGGGAGDAEPGGTVYVYADDVGPAPPAHPLGGGGTLWCQTVADGVGAWSCTGPPLTINRYWMFGSTQTDAAGNSTGSPDDEFAILILPPPAAPTVGSFGLPGELPPST